MKYHLWTEGCQMNVADSQRVAGTLEEMGYLPVSDAKEADLVVLNTCVVRQSAENKAYNHLQSLKPIKKANPELVINLMGCLVGRADPQSLTKAFPMVDVFSPPSDLRPLVAFLNLQAGKSASQEDLERQVAAFEERTPLPASQAGKTVAAFVPIVLGCSHACTYCVIPSKRGAEMSRPPLEIMNEVRWLVALGVREVTLLGQIVDRYGKDNTTYPNLAGLLKELNGIDGLKRIRFLTSHPTWMTDELLASVANLPKVMPHIEVPAQAGDDQILTAMRRGYTAAQYRDLIANIRSVIPHVSIGTDIIVGFPGETEEAFQNTYRLLEDLRLDVAHLARYSPRAGTVSARTMEDNVPDAEKWSRFRTLEELQEKIAGEIHSRYLGGTVEVLFEEKVKNRWRGRTPNNELVFAPSDDDLRGRVLPVKIDWTGPWSMVGILA